MAPVDPWRKRKIIKVIAAMDIMIASFSIFYSGKTLIVVFGLLKVPKSSWVFFLLIFFLTFGIHLTQIILALLLIRSCHENPSSRLKAIVRTKTWCIASAIFTVLLILELYIGMNLFERNAWIVLFLVFCIGKLFWRIFGIYYVGAFREDLKFVNISAEEPEQSVKFLKVPVNLMSTASSSDITGEDSQITSI